MGNYWVAVAFALLGPLLMWRVLLGRTRRPTSAVHGDGESLSVIIPARNEAQRLPALLRSLQQQTVSPREVIVVDDESTDDTVAIACAAGATVLGGQPLPEGWNGKAWACWQGAAASGGESLLFLDADTWLEPDGLDTLLQLHATHGGLISVQPYHVTCRPYEQLSAFFNIVLMAAMGAFTPLGARLRPGGAFGPCMLCSREDYNRAGGHRAVRAEVLEDIPLGKQFLRSGLSVWCEAGRGIISFRMYPGGLAELVEGWSKGMGYGAASVRPLFTVLTAAWITGCFAAFIEPIKSLVVQGGLPLGATAALYVVYALEVAAILHQIGRFAWWAPVVYPVLLIAFALLMVRSAVLTFVLRRVRWKGRTIVRRTV